MPTAAPLEEEQEEVTTNEVETPVVEQDDSNEFSELADDLLADDQITDYGLEAATEGEEEVTTEEETPSGEEEPAGEEPPLAATTEEETIPEPTAPTETPTPEPEVAAEETPEVQIEESEETPEPDKSYETLRAEALDELEKEFSVSEEDAQTLVTEPEKVLPKMAASIYMAAYENATKSIMAALPQMITQTISYQTTATEATNAFYSKWDKLDRNNPKHTQTIDRIGKVYRQVNPNVSQEQFTAEVGAQALMALGIPFEEIVDAPPVETPKPFQPAATSGVAPVAKKAPTNEWSELAEELINDDSM